MGMSPFDKEKKNRKTNSQFFKKKKIESMIIIAIK